MTDDELAHESWAVDIPGLREEQAVRFRDLLLPQVDRGIILLDPKKGMLRGYDRSTVELLVTCFEAALVSAHLSHVDRAGVLSMLEDCLEWLDFSSSDSA